MGTELMGTEENRSSRKNICGRVGAAWSEAPASPLEIATRVGVYSRHGAIYRVGTRPDLPETDVSKSWDDGTTTKTASKNTWAIQTIDHATSTDR